ncbi:MAG: hypothetical protein CMJ78_20695 [Planctomycetaceae bacterium]|nr:hypothetical protein [Planctomycetaceae bacterium]
MKLRLFTAGTICLCAVTAASWAAKPGDWPQWRGPNRTGHSKETGLLKEWPEEGPKVAWKVDTTGVGYSSLAVSDGRIFTQGDLDGVEHIIAINEKDGSLLWAVQPAPVVAALDERIEKTFANADKDKDGQLSEMEALAAIGWNLNKADTKDEDANNEELAQARAKNYLENFDKDKSGGLSYTEVHSQMMREFARIDQPDGNADAKQLAADRAQRWLKSLDKNADDNIDQRESRGTIIQRFFRNMDAPQPNTGRGDGKLTKAEMADFFWKRERGKDGSLSADELASYFLRQYPGRDGVLVKTDFRRYLGGYRNGQGDGPRGTPTVEGERVYTEGGFGDLTCSYAKTGATIWHVNLTTDFGGGRPGWGYSESPLIDGDNIIATPGGNGGALVALDKMTGDVVWQSEEIKDRAHYSSPIVTEVNGVRQIIQFTRQRVVGVDAKTGKLLWSYKNSANGTANCATPIYSDNHVFSSSSYGTGGGLAKLTKGNEGFSSEEVYFSKSMANHHGGVVLVDDHMYGFGNGGLICMNFMTGEIAWRNRSVNKGSLCYADGDLYCLGERNQLALVAANPKEYVEKGRVDLPRSGRPTWAHPVVANGRLYIRDLGSLTSYNVSASPAE